MISYERLFVDSGVLVSSCSVRDDLAQFLTDEEKASMQASTAAVLNRASAARMAARDLLRTAGFPAWSLPRKHGDAPDWPPGWTGSISHSDEYAAAAIAHCDVVAGVGIDIEPAEPLPDELHERIVVATDVTGPYPADIAGRILFCAKEASYKAVYPVDRQFLEFDDMTVDLATGHAKTSYGRRVNLTVHLDHRIVVLAQLAIARD
jgi:4'-phosphopantetheinyl transferase EntD